MKFEFQYYKSTLQTSAQRPGCWLLHRISILQKYSSNTWESYAAKALASKFQYYKSTLQTMIRTMNDFESHIHFNTTKVLFKRALRQTNTWPWSYFNTTKVLFKRNIKRSRNTSTIGISILQKYSSNRHWGRQVPGLGRISILQKYSSNMPRMRRGKTNGRRFQYYKSTLQTFLTQIPCRFFF